MARALSVLVIVSLVAAAVFCQPQVNAPLLNRVNFVEAPGQAGTLPVAVARGISFTTTYNSTVGYGVIALNHSQTSSAGAASFFDKLPWQPTSIFSVGIDAVVVVANDSVIFYHFNETAIWRAGIFTETSVSFDIYRQTSGLFPNPLRYDHGFLYIGSQNRSASAWSTIYSFNATGAMPQTPLWMTKVPFQSSNYMMHADEMGPRPESQMAWVWAMTYNSGDKYILQFWAHNGTLVNTIDTTDSSSSIQFGVSGRTIAIMSYSNYYYFFDINGTLIASKSLNQCYNVRFAPAMVNGSWYLSCSSWIYIFDNTTYVKRASLQSNGGNDFTAAAVSMWGHIIVASGAYVYTINSTNPELYQIAYFADTIYSSASPVGMSWVFNTTLVQISYDGTYGGIVLAIDFITTQLYGQITGNLDPIGTAWFDPWLGLNFVASSTSVLLQVYNVTVLRNTTSNFVKQFSSSTPSTYPFVQNGTYGFYFTYSTAYRVNLVTGETTTLGGGATYSSSTTPIVIGNYVCVFYTAPSDIYCWNNASASTQTPTTKSVCSYTTQSRIPYVIIGSLLLINCESTSFYLFDPAANTVTSATSYSTTYPAAASSKAIYGVTYPYSYVAVYALDLTKDPTITKLVAYSNPVVVGENVFAFAFSDAFASSEGLITTPALYKLDPTTGATIGMAFTKNNNGAAQSLMAAWGGQYGAGVLYLYGATNLTAFTVGNFDFSFEVTPISSPSRSALGGPLATSNGGLAFYAQDGNVHMLDAFNGAHAWWSPVYSVGSSLPLVESNGLLFFSNGRSVVGADIFSGEQRTALAYTSQGIVGFGVINGTDNVSTIVGAAGNFIFSSTTQLAPSQGSFSGGGNNGGGGGGGESSKAWIAAIVVGLLVVVIAIVVVIKMKGNSAGSDPDYVPMNPATQV